MFSDSLVHLRSYCVVLLLLGRARHQRQSIVNPERKRERDDRFGPRAEQVDCSTAYEKARWF